MCAYLMISPFSIILSIVLKCNTFNIIWKKAIFPFKSKMHSKRMGKYHGNNKVSRSSFIKIKVRLHMMRLIFKHILAYTVQPIGWGEPWPFPTPSEETLPILGSYYSEPQHIEPDIKATIIQTRWNSFYSTKSYILIHIPLQCVSNGQ